MSICWPFPVTGRLWRRLPRFVVLAVATALASLVAGAQPAAAPVHTAPDPGLRPYALRRARAAVALQEFARQSDLQIMFAMDAVKGVRTNPVQGRFSPDEALRLLLENTPLLAHHADSGAAIVVTRRERNGFGTIATTAAQSISGIDEDGTIHLNPFEVPAHSDHGYGALQSNSLTAFRADLQSLPVTVELFTRDLMDDLATTTIEDLVIHHGGTAGFRGSAINATPGDRDGGGGLSLRGMSVSPIKRDGFIGLWPNERTFTGQTDSYSTERVELLGGPQSLLYGGSGGGGVVNLVSKHARFDHTGGLARLSIDSRGGNRLLLDLNQGGENLALRVVAARQNVHHHRKLLGARFDGLYAQLAWRPFATTTVRLWAERNRSDVQHAYQPSLNSFLAPDDARFGASARFLALTGKIDDLDISYPTLNYRTLESLAGWWASERIANNFVGLSTETTFTPWLSAQVSLIYGETSDRRIATPRQLLPAAAPENPLGVTAMLVTPADNQQPRRVRGARAVLLAEGHLAGGLIHSRTALGVEAVHQTDVDSIDYAYYLADADGNLIIDPAIPTEYGRTRLGPIPFAITPGRDPFPLFKPGTDRVTVNGLHYVRQARIRTDPAAVTTGNPLGLLPNNSGVGNGFLGHYSHADSHSRGVFVANISDWFDGRFTTLAGARYGLSSHLNAGENGVSHRPRWDETLTGNLGISLRLRHGFNAYATFSSSYIPQPTQTRDLIGDSLRPITARSPVPEIGLKYIRPDERLMATLAYNFSTEQRNEAVTVDPSFLDAVNPAGLNGRFGDPDRWVNVDRRSRGAELKLTAQPTRGWRTRLSIGFTDGDTQSDVRFPQFYNDEFHTDGAGTVTYADGTPVLVDPAAVGTSGTTPLTLAMLADPAHPYHAAPDPDSGQITGANALAALSRIDPIHGAVATGRTGLPLSAMQYPWPDPNGHEGTITVFNRGEKSTGYNAWEINLQNRYEFTQGPLRGLGIFADLRTSFDNRAYYVQRTAPGARPVSGERKLFSLPRVTTVGIALSYRRDLRDGRTWTTQLNVTNLLDHSRVWTLPNPANGIPNLARLSAEPRAFIWTNTLEF